MKLLSLARVALATVLLFWCTSFTPVKERSSSHRDANYFWYLDNGTVYDGWFSTSQEITRLENTYGVEVDTDPVNGTLIASGYFVKGYPHLVYPSVLLYSH
jgi:hypothetical protein